MAADVMTREKMTDFFLPVCFVAVNKLILVFVL